MKIRPLLLALLAWPWLVGCPKVPVTGRHSLILISETEQVGLGESAYREMLKGAKVSRDAAATAMVRRAGERIARVSHRPDYAWEFALIDDPKTQNAFCLPGGKVAVYSGILPVTKTETGLAVVMSHEIAHAIAKHGAERMSHQLLVALGGETLSMAMKEKPAETRAAILQAYGLGTTVGAVLPFSRYQESEADRIGLIYMAKAGYDPREALEFWKRMDAASSGPQPPQFLSTHPRHETRIKDLEKWMPEALGFYQSSQR